ncbi:hypothetical protein Tco_1360302 [Tanacetum coccineum]
MIGSLMYLIANRLDIHFSTCLFARYQANRKESHLIAVKRISRYLKDTPSLGLWYLKCSSFDLKGYLDPDYVGCNIDRKSTSAEAEHVVVARCCANILWMKSQLADYDIIYEKVPIFCDNTSAIAISNNPILHSRTKHIDIRYHFIRDHILKGDIELHFIPTQYQHADIFTMTLDEPTFKRLIIELVNIRLEAFTRTPTQYKKYLMKFWYTAKVLKDSTKVWFSTPMGGIMREVGVTSFRNAIGANYLYHSRDYAHPPTIEVIREWFPTIGYNRTIEATCTLKKGLLPPRWRLLVAQIIQCLGGKTSGFYQISNKDAIILYCLANAVNIDFAKIIWDDIISKLKKKTKEKVIPYLRFLSLLLEHKMEGYGTDEVNFNPTQIFIVHNWTLKKNQPKGPPFTAHILAIFSAGELVAFQALNTSSYIKKHVPQGKKPGVKTRHRKTPNSSKHNPMSKIEATKGVSSSKEATESPTGHSKKKKKSSLAKDFNPSEPPASTLVVDGIHKDALQATGGPTSLGVTSEVRADPQLISVVSASTTKPVYSAFTILHSESASGYDASADSMAKTNPGKSAPNDSDTNNAEKEANFDKDEFNTSYDLSSSDDDKEIKMEDLSKMVKDVDVDFMDLDSPKVDEPIFVQDEEEEEVHAEEVHAEQDNKTEDTLVLDPPSPKSIKIYELSTQLLLLQALNLKLLTKLPVQSLKPELSKLLTIHDFSPLILKEMKELPIKISEICGEITDLRKYVVELNKLKLEVPARLLALPGQVSSITTHLTKLKSLDALLSLLTNVNEALSMFAHAIELAYKKTKDHGVPSVGQAGTHHTEGDKNTQQSKGKEAMSHKDVEEEESETDSEHAARLTCFIVESSKKKHLKKFDFVTQKGDHVHLIEEQIKEQNRIEESIKTDMAKKEEELGK